MGFVLGLPTDSDGKTSIVVFDMAHSAAVPDSIIDEGAALLFIYQVFKQHGSAISIVIDRDPRFTS